GMLQHGFWHAGRLTQEQIAAGCDQLYLLFTHSVMRNYLAFDLGAESGRAILGAISAGKLMLEELHRFPNTPVPVSDGLYWDTPRLWHEIQQAIAAVRDRNLVIDGIGVDTWGVDFGLLGSDGMLIDTPRHYRDSRTNGVMEKLFAMVPRNEVF